MYVRNTDSQIDTIMRQLNLTADIELSYAPGQSLQVEKNGNTACITYGRRVELFRGLGLLAENAHREHYSVTQPARFRMDGMMLDCSRNGVMKPEMVKKFIRYMAVMGMDTLMLYTEDTYEIPEYPYFGYLRGRYSCNELKALDDYADGFGIELIPCIQTLAHLDGVMRWPCFDNVRDCDNILLCGEEKTYQLIEAMIKACRNCFRTKQIHVGMDEAIRLGLGKYLERNGYERQEEIFCRHLCRVNEICKKYGFQPMIWSDMFFRMAFQGEYYPTEDVHFDSRVLEKVPHDVALVYWDYYNDEKKIYDNQLDNHFHFQNRILFAGGAWRWIGHAPALRKSLYQTRLALQSCIEKGVQDVFLTAWGDNGNEASFLCVLPVMQLYAELCYQGNVSDEELARRLRTCTGEHLSDMLLMDIPNSVDENHAVCSDATPAKYMQYMDVLGGLAESHTTSQYPQKYEQGAILLAEAAKRSLSCGYAYELLSDLCSVLAIKSREGVDAQKAYHKGDRTALQQIADKTLPELLNRLSRFHESMYTQWVTECKINGYEVLDLRLGGLEARIKTCIQRIQSYLSGEIDGLSELEEERLPMDCRTKEELASSEVMCNNFWAPAFSAGIV